MAQQPNVGNTQQPNITQNSYAYRSPFTYNHRSPFTYNHRSPYTYNHRSPFTYQSRQPNNARTSAQQPFTFQSRQPNNARASAQQPFTFQSREPNNARQPYTTQTPFTHSSQEPNIRSSQEPNIRAGQEPNIGRQPGQARSPVTYNYRTPTFGGGGGGCFAAGSLVWLADGSHSPIENVVVGQMLMTWNESAKLIQPKEFSKILEPRICSIYDVVLSDGRTIQTTDSHPLMLDTLEWGAIDVEACVREHKWMEGVNSHELKIGDSLFSMTDAIMFDRQDESGLEIVDINENADMTVYNLSGVENNHTYFVNGMLVHNFEEK